MPFEFKPLKIPDVKLITPRVFPDGRGYFLEAYKKSDFLENGIEHDFVQDNYCLSHRGVLRGLHYQKQPSAQGKLTHVVSGRVYDVAVDMRKGSPYFGQWVGVELSAESHEMLWVPPGFAHGVLILEDNTHFTYKTTNEYNPTLETGFAWNDDELAIDWPIAEPILSERDQAAVPFKEADNNFIFGEV